VAYRLPTFNISCGIYSGDGSPFPVVPEFDDPRIEEQECALVFGRRVNMALFGGQDELGLQTLSMSLLLPPSTDVRGREAVTGPDIVECPSGTHRWYWVVSVDDIGKGWPNEHRVAVLVPIPGTWPVPHE
jgi:hypothetical protein